MQVYNFTQKVCNNINMNIDRMNDFDEDTKLRYIKTEKKIL